jgi:hypothetical protein
MKSIPYSKHNLWNLPIRKLMMFTRSFWTRKSNTWSLESLEQEWVYQALNSTVWWYRLVPIIWILQNQRKSKKIIIDGTKNSSIPLRRTTLISKISQHFMFISWMVTSPFATSENQLSNLPKESKA